MLSPIQASIKREILDPALSGRHHMMVGWVLEYDHIHNLATVEINDPNAGGRSIIDQVPVQIPGGMSQSGPFKGDEVWITFIGGSRLHPRITAFGDKFYSQNTREGRMRHGRKGAMIPDSIMRWS